MSARIPHRSITPAGWGWRWRVSPCGPGGHADGWTLTRAGALRVSARYLAAELDLWHRHTSSPLQPPPRPPLETPSYRQETKR